MTVLFLAPLLSYAFVSGASVVGLIGIALLLIVPISDFALSALNLDVTALFKPKPLPKMNMTSGIPEAGRTIIVIPSIFSSEDTVRSLLENIEVHFLANRDQNVYFALLGDFADSSNEEEPGDDDLLETATKGIKELNARYGEPDRFHLFHRRRKWNPVEEKWMGWERKRGKLHGRLLIPCFSGNGSLRHYARFRYSIASRQRPPARRHRDAPAQPASS
jgi:cyclic beta-1,2-glucan synthetase